MLAAVTAIAALATNYTGTLTVTVNGESTTTESTINVEQSGDNCTLSINDFELDGIPIGNIIITSPYTTQYGATIINVSKNITITEGSNPEKEWIGPSLGEVPINMSCIFKDGALFNNINIYLSLLKQTINVQFLSNDGFVNKFGAEEGYQLPNSNFETWTASSGEPDYWHGFKSCKGAMSGLVNIAGMSLEKSTDNHSGSYSAVVTSGGGTFLVKPIANGTMTTGQLNAGSSTASDVSNHSEMDKTSTETDNNGKPFYTKMFGRPDAIKTWIKFSQGTPNSDHPYATISTIIFDGSYYQDPEDPEHQPYNNVTAKAQDKNIAVTGWRELIVPFTGYTNVAPQAILVTVSTNADPGQGSRGDKVFVDDMELVYLGSITNITVNGLEGLFTFDANTHTYNIEATGTFTENDVNVTKTGAYSYLLKSVNAIESGYIITVTVIPNDMSKAEVYTINVTTPVVDVTLDGVLFTKDRQWATWYGDQDLVLPDNVTANVVIAINNNKVEIDNNVDYLPANVGLLLYSNTPASSITTQPYTGTKKPYTSKLQGSTSAQTVSNAYVLYNNDFILLQDNTEVPAHRCYLPVPEGQDNAPLILRIGNSTVTAITGIENIVNGKTRYFDLNGREVNENATGILLRQNPDGTVTKVVK